jgi:hypothetical protein
LIQRPQGWSPKLSASTRIVGAYWLSRSACSDVLPIASGAGTAGCVLGPANNRCLAVWWAAAEGLSGIAPEAQEQGWGFPLQYFSRRHELSRRAWEATTSWADGAVPTDYEVWEALVWSRPAPQPLTHDEAEAQRGKRLVDPVRLARAIQTRIEWEGALVWLELVKSACGFVPKWARAKLKARFGVSLADCDVLPDAAARGHAVVLRDARDGGWDQCVTFYAYEHLRWLRIDDYARHCRSEWRRLAPDPLADFDAWLAAADTYTVPWQRSSSSVSISDSGPR